MIIKQIVLASVISATTWGSDFASSVVNYNPGVGFAAGYTNASVALGSPAQTYRFGGTSYFYDPFGPAYDKVDLVSVGQGGSITLGFDTPIRNDPTHRFGLDFVVFGNSFFTVTNGFDANFNYIGTPRTDGILVGGNSGTTRIFVSEDNLSFFQLDPNRAAVVDGFFPSDGAGNPLRAVDSAVSPGAFQGASLEDIRALYNGAGGGTGFDLGWAIDGNGSPVAVENARFVRIDVLSGKSEIDAISAVPEPGVWGLMGVALAAVVLRRCTRLGKN